MGERTQLFINIEDATGKQILGTVIHYQWGFGRVMLESALHIATNIEAFIAGDYGKSDEQKIAEAKLNELLKKYCGFKKPALTYELRKSIGKNIGTGGVLNISTEEVEQALKGPVRDLQEEKLSVDWVQDPVLDLKTAYAAKYSNFFRQCDNNDGLMFMNIQTDEPVESLSSYYLSESEIKFGFALTNDLYGENRDWHPTTFDNYAGQRVNRNFLTEDFVKGYKLILKGYGIKMMSPDELESRKKK